MSRAAKVSLVFSLVAVFAAYMAWREQRRFSQDSSISFASAPSSSSTNPLPKLLYLGGDSTEACRQMMRIMDELKADYAGSFSIESIDTVQQPDALKTHQIQSVPAQIFLGSNRQELYRHEGSLSKVDILARWKELGVTTSP
jgi:thiol-disulfide isomerase/thioredoxin